MQRDQRLQRRLGERHRQPFTLFQLILELLLLSGLPGRVPGGFLRDLFGGFLRGAELSLEAQHLSVRAIERLEFGGGISGETGEHPGQHGHRSESQSHLPGYTHRSSPGPLVSLRRQKYAR
ncbi:hypothetical protein J5X84_06810 [Streptosporangiaceae bacterium NEAU-GS5]|nr:hypothetical protein [Streptosporangiaceae bacterium NEAU-GS5]